MAVSEADIYAFFDTFINNNPDTFDSAIHFIWTMYYACVGFWLPKVTFNDIVIVFYWQSLNGNQLIAKIFADSITMTFIEDEDEFSITQDYHEQPMKSMFTNFVEESRAFVVRNIVTIE